MNKCFIFFIFISLSFTQISNHTLSDAEISAMAGATVSKVGSNYSIFNNPAGITEINKFLFWGEGVGSIFLFTSDKSDVSFIKPEFSSKINLVFNPKLPDMVIRVSSDS